MPHPENVTGATLARKQRLYRVLYATIAEIFQKRISGAERKKSKRRALALRRFGKQSIHDFVGCPIAPNSNKVTNTACVGVASDGGGVRGRVSFGNVNLEASGAQTLERWPKQLPSFAAPSRRIHNRKVAFPHGIRRTQRLKSV